MSHLMAGFMIINSTIIDLSADVVNGKIYKKGIFTMKKKMCVFIKK